MLDKQTVFTVYLSSIEILYKIRISCILELRSHGLQLLKIWQGQNLQNVRLGYVRLGGTLITLDSWSVVYFSEVKLWSSVLFYDYKPFIREFFIKSCLHLYVVICKVTQNIVRDPIQNAYSSRDHLVRKFCNSVGLNLDEYTVGLCHIYGGTLPCRIVVCCNLLG